MKPKLELIHKNAQNIFVPHFTPARWKQKAEPYLTHRHHDKNTLFSHLWKKKTNLWLIKAVMHVQHSERTAETRVQRCHFTSTCSAFAKENSSFQCTLARTHTHSQVVSNLTVSNSLALTMKCCRPNQSSHCRLFTSVMLIFFSFAEMVFTLYPPLHTLWPFPLEENHLDCLNWRKTFLLRKWLSEYMHKSKRKKKKSRPGVQKHTHVGAQCWETLNPQRELIYLAPLL